MCNGVYKHRFIENCTNARWGNHPDLLVKYDPIFFSRQTNSDISTSARWLGESERVMKAVIYEIYGSPEVLQLREIEKPPVADDQVIVKVHAASIQQTDTNFRSGTPFLARVISGLLRPKNQILGCDYSGIIEATGKNIDMFNVGDEVYGQLDKRTGTHAEYISVSMNEISPKPKNLNFVEAASVGVAGTMALQFLRDHGEIKQGQKVLINGSSGGIGTFAVQIAKYFDTEVTGVCSTTNLEMVKSIGANHVIDYTKENFTKRTNEYDIIFDAVRKSTFANCKNALTPKGIYVTTEFGPSVMLQMRMNSNPNRKRMVGALLNLDPQDLVFLTDLIEAEKIRPVIDRVYPLEEIADAHRYVEKGHAKGKVVIKNV
jgi:NADPH:quinone reductase-like Zn-dependent oxidoreductase